MEINNKYNYEVYSRYYLNTSDINNNLLSGWRYEGSTRAVSEKKAINNVRCRNYGKTSSQYKPFEIGGHYEKGLEWKAEMNEEFFNVRMIYQILKDKEIIPKDWKLSNVGNYISIFKKELNIKEIKKDTTENGTMYYSKEDTKRLIENFRKINYQKVNYKSEQLQLEDVEQEDYDIYKIKNILEEKNLIKKNYNARQLSCYLVQIKKILGINGFRKKKSTRMYYSKDDVNKILDYYEKEKEMKELGIKEEKTEESIEETSDLFKKAIEKIVEKKINEKLKEIQEKITELKTTNDEFEEKLKNMNEENNKTIRKKIMSLIEFLKIEK
jgi:hypothetical protein